MPGSHWKWLGEFVCGLLSDVYTVNGLLWNHKVGVVNSGSIWAGDTLKYLYAPVQVTSA
jgi:hypothetical protein